MNARAEEIEKAAGELVAHMRWRAAMLAQSTGVAVAFGALKVALAMPVEDTFPRAPRDAEEREACASSVFGCDADSAQFACTRIGRHVGDHVASDGERIVARWPQSPPNASESPKGSRCEDERRWGLWFLGAADACGKCDPDDDRHQPGWCHYGDNLSSGPSTFATRAEADAFRTRWVRVRDPERFEVRPYPAPPEPHPQRWGVACQGVGQPFWSADAREKSYATEAEAEAEADRLAARYAGDVPASGLRYFAAPRDAKSTPPVAPEAKAERETFWWRVRIPNFTHPLQWSVCWLSSDGEPTSNPSNAAEWPTRREAEVTRARAGMRKTAKITRVTRKATTGGAK